MSQSVTNLLTIVISVLALVISGAVYLSSRKQTNTARDQAEIAARSYRHARQIGHSQAVLQFIGQFTELMNAGPKFDDSSWSYVFWSLHSTEFYFYHNDMLPEFIYQLWMMDLASLYVDDDAAWRTHDKYLTNYQFGYGEMREFFEEIKSIAAANKEIVRVRNRGIVDYMQLWKSGHPGGYEIS